MSDLPARLRAAAAAMVREGSTVDEAHPAHLLELAAERIERLHEVYEAAMQIDCEVAIGRTLGPAFPEAVDQSVRAVAEMWPRLQAALLEAEKVVEPDGARERGTLP